MKGLVGQVGAAVCVWGVGALLYGLTESLTNTAVGLYLPAGVLGAVYVIYSVFGVLAGVGLGVALVLWRRWRRAEASPPAAIHMAAFLAGVTLLYAGERINDRFLPGLLAPSSIAVNVLLVVAAVGLGVVLYRHLRGMESRRRAVAFVFLALSFAAFVSIGLDVDTFVIQGMETSGVVLLYVALAAGCALLYGAWAWASSLAMSRGAWGRTLVATAAAVGVVVAFGVSLSLSSVGRSASGVPPPQGVPNVVWIVLDTTRPDHLSTYGYPRPTTPNIDRAAAEGAVFEHALAGSSWTIPSHFQMITGRLAAGERKVLDQAFTTAAEAFQRRGYRTGAVLANMSLGRLSGFEQGFESFLDAPPVLLYLEVLEKISLPAALVNHHVLSARTVLRLLYRRTMMMSGRAQADVVSGHVVDWLRTQNGSPFFLFVNYMDPHEPYDPPAPFRGRFKPGIDPEEGCIRYDRASGKFISTEEFTRDLVPHMTPARWENLIALYDEELAFMDDQVGAVIAELKRLGVYDRTVLVVTADHGELFGEHGLATHFKSLSEEEIHVPLVMRYPARIPAGTRIGATVETVDILPTVLDTAGVEATDEMDGRSLLPVIASGGAGPDDVHAETYSFLLRPADREFPHTAPGDLIALRTSRSKYVWSSTGRHAYYDLASDPKETRNLFGDGSQLADVAAKVESWRHSIGLDAVSRKMDRLTADRLRSLGYIK